MQSESASALPKGRLSRMNTARIEPITASDMAAVAHYLAPTFDYARSEEQWRRVLQWMIDLDPPNLGFQLIADGRIVGAFLAIYQDVGDATVCHLSAWLVDEAYRMQSLPLFRALLQQDVDAFTDYTPAPHVRPINRRLGFRDLETTAYRVWNFRWPGAPRGVQVVTEAEEIEKLLTGPDLRAFLDHRGIPDVGQLVIVDGDRVCLVVYRTMEGRLTRSRLLDASDRELFLKALGPVLWRIGWRLRSPFTTAEARILGGHPSLSITADAVPRQYKSERVPESSVTELYSSLVWSR